MADTSSGAPRRPARRKMARKRRAGWRFVLRAFLTAAATTAAAAWLAGAAARSPRLHVSATVVDGAHWMAEGVVRGAVDGLHGQHILAVDLEAARAGVRRLPWVRDARLRRVLPSTVEVAVTERTPVGIARLGRRLYLVDGEGVLLDDYGPRFAALRLPIVDGLEGRGAATAAVDRRRAALAARLIRQVARHEDLAGLLSQIDVRDPEDAVVLVTGDPARIHLGRERFVERLGTYLDIAPSLREHESAIEAVDLRFGRRVYVQPAADGGDERRGRRAS